MTIRLELIECGSIEPFANMRLPVCPKVDEWIIRVRDDGQDWREPFEGLRCYQVRVRRFLSNGRIRLHVQRGVQYEDMVRDEFPHGWG